MSNYVQYPGPRRLGSLCSWCNDVLISPWSSPKPESGEGNGWHLLNARNICETSPENCRICRMLQEHLDGNKVYTTTTICELPPVVSVEVWGTRVIYPETFNREYQFLPKHSRPKLRLHFSAMAGRQASCLGHMEFSSHLNSQQIWNLARGWMTQCLLEHHECSTVPVTDPKRMNLISVSDWHPTRLVDLGDPQDNLLRPRLIICAMEVLYKNETYMTLSHCWGNARRFELRKSNIEELRQSINLKELPQTYRDAMISVKSLGCRLLWIDSLCIIQDSEEDWRRESQLMSQVYSKSVCNLEAMNSKNDEEGFLITRDPDIAVPFFVNTVINNSVVSFQVAKDNKHDMDTSNFALSQRAWVLQEQLLAPRSLLFGKDEIMWHCRKLKASETRLFGEGIVGERNNEFVLRCILARTARIDKLFGRDARNPTFMYETLSDIWATIVQDYSKRSLTRAQDKLVAISGLAQAMKPWLGMYFSGLWGRHMPWELLWETEKHPRLPFRPVEWRAPSWSWASVEGTIQYSQTRSSKPIFLGDRVTIAKVVHIDIKTIDGSEFGAPVSGTIHIHGPLGTGSCRRSPSADLDESEYPLDNHEEDYLYLADCGKCGTINFDQPITAPEVPRNGHIFLFAVMQGVFFNDGELVYYLDHEGPDISPIFAFDSIAKRRPSRNKQHGDIEEKNEVKISHETSTVTKRIDLPTQSKAPPESFHVPRNSQASEQKAVEPGDRNASESDHSDRSENSDNESTGGDRSSTEEAHEPIIYGLVLVPAKNDASKFQRIGLFEVTGTTAVQTIQRWGWQRIAID